MVYAKLNIHRPIALICLVKNKTEAYLLCVNTLIIISVIFVIFYWIFLLGGSFCGAWADFHWNYERSFSISVNRMMLIPKFKT